MSKTLSEEIEGAIPAIRDIGFKTWSAAIRQQAADIKALREEAQRIFEQGHYTMQDYDRLKAVLAATDPNRPLGEDA